MRSSRDEAVEGEVVVDEAVEGEVVDDADVEVITVDDPDPSRGLEILDGYSDSDRRTNPKFPPVGRV